MAVLDWTRTLCFARLWPSEERTEESGNEMKLRILRWMDDRMSVERARREQECETELTD